MAILWGEMIFPAVEPVVLAAASQEGSMSMFAAIPACNFPKRMFAEVPATRDKCSYFPDQRGPESVILPGDGRECVGQ